MRTIKLFSSFTEYYRWMGTSPYVSSCAIIVADKTKDDMNRLYSCSYLEPVNLTAALNEFFKKFTMFEDILLHKNLISAMIQDEIMEFVGDDFSYLVDILEDHISRIEVWFKRPKDDQRLTNYFRGDVL